MTLLEVRDLDARYGAVQALRGVSLQVGQEEMVALLGPNGAGKTTLLRAISGMLRPAGGEVLLDGERIDGLPPHEVVRRGVAHVPEGRDLFPQLSVAENLQAGYWVRRRDRGGLAGALEWVMEIFPPLRQRAGQAAGTLSGGEQQMLAIARALMSRPRLLVVDELSLGLAPKVVAQLFSVLGEVNRAGTAVMVVEQFVHLALTHTRRAYVLARGQVVMEGSSRELLESEQLIASYLGEDLGPRHRGRGGPVPGSAARPR